jgi:hypothetical protein
MLPRVMRRIALLVVVLAAAACGPKIGDECTDSLECAVDGTRFCDQTQPDGYCLIPGCRADECPEEAVCVRFGLDEQARTFCLQHCEGNGDCRTGYVCAAPEPLPVPASEGEPLPVATEIIDDAPQGRRFCTVRAD